MNAGGSGCGCGGSVLCSHILKKMEQGALHKVLFVATGALMSAHQHQAGQLHSRCGPRRGIGGVSVKTHYVKDIRVLSAFQQTIRAMQILILVLRVLAVAFLVLQSITLMRDNA